MPFKLQFKKRTPDPKHRVTRLRRLAEEAPEHQFARVSDAAEDAILRAFQGDENISLRTWNVIGLWLNDNKRSKIQALLFAGAYPEDIAKILKMQDTEVVRLFARVFFDLSVFEDLLDKEDYAYRCKALAEQGINSYENSALYEAYKHGLDFLIARYTDTIPTEKILRTMLKDEFVEYMGTRGDVSETTRKHRYRSINQFLKTAKSIPALRDKDEAQENFMVRLKSDLEERQAARKRRHEEKKVLDLGYDDLA